MKRILLSTLTSITLFYGASSQTILAQPQASEKESPSVQSPLTSSKTGEELAKDCETRLAKIKDSGTTLSPTMKAKFDYNLAKATLEIGVLRNPNHGKSHSYVAACQRHVTIAEKTIKRHEYKRAQQKKRDEVAKQEKSMEKKS